WTRAARRGRARRQHTKSLKSRRRPRARHRAIAARGRWRAVVDRELRPADWRHLWWAGQDCRTGGRSAETGADRRGAATTAPSENLRPRRLSTLSARPVPATEAHAGWI